MRTRLQLLVVTLTLALALSSTVQAYYGKYSTEAELRFNAVADVAWTGAINATTLAALNQGGKSHDRALELVDAQIQHLMGTFQSATFGSDFGAPGVLGERYRVRFTGIEKSSTGRARISYAFTGKTVFHTRAFSHGRDLRDIPLTLPVAPDLVYAQSTPRGSSVNPCTDAHYNTEGDFWYFWDPELPRCPLGKGRAAENAVLRLTGQLKRLPNSEGRYPEYGRLYGDNGNGSKLEIAAFFGYIEDVADPKHPARRDDGYRTVSQLEEELIRRGFIKTEDVTGFREKSNGARMKGSNILRRYEREITALGKPVQVGVTIFLGDTSIAASDMTFHRHFVPALESADIVTYDGHSGLGSNLDLRQLPQVVFDAKKYQIFLFNGCSTYPYYNRDYFDAKGSKGRALDVIVSGLPTYSSSSLGNNVAFLSSFIDGRTPSYATIFNNFEKSNRASDVETSLMGVAGEQNNRWKP